MAAVVVADGEVVVVADELEVAVHRKGEVAVEVHLRDEWEAAVVGPDAAAVDGVHASCVAAAASSFLKKKQLGFAYATDGAEAVTVVVAA